jgi:hypothetical protein
MGCDTRAPLITEYLKGESMSEEKSYPDWRCAHTDSVMGRCRGAGAISHSTRGDGPWYCAHHYFGRDGEPPSMEERERLAATGAPLMDWDAQPRRPIRSLPTGDGEVDEPGTNG